MTTWKRFVEKESKLENPTSDPNITLLGHYKVKLTLNSTRSEVLYHITYGQPVAPSPKFHFVCLRFAPQSAISKISAIFHFQC